MSCVETCEKTQAACCNKSCRYWLDYPQDLNCTIICANNHGSLTLVEVAKRIGVSHVRIKQIQDKAMKKLNKKILESNI
mgnify:CR=1 FL=1